MICKLLAPASDFHKEMTNVRKYCITKSPGFAGVALLPQYHVVDPKDEQFGKEYGFTDGKSIYLGTRLFKESAKAQAFVLMHEVLHVALRHPQRGLALRKARVSRGLTWSSEVFNWAVDAIVNFSLDKTNSWTNKPDCGLVTFDKLLKADVLTAMPPHKWSAESLFKYLMDEVIQPQIDKGMKDATEWGKGNLPKDGQGMLDIEIPMEAGGVAEDTKEEARDWEGRVKRAAAGDRAGGVMKEILFDIPVTKTPWQHILRRFISDAVMPQTQIRPSRPSRQNIILEAFHQETNNTSLVPFSPAFRPKPGIRKIVVVVDTSGSIDDRMCEYFAGEIQSIRKRVGCDLTLITCDAEVHQTINIKAHESLHKVIKQAGGFKGRGGTDFVPGVTAAEKVTGAAVIVYLTDMCGPYPNRCRFPLLWASTNETYNKPPCGTVVVLKVPE
jgi:predicted metal-dependent peptidase